MKKRYKFLRIGLSFVLAVCLCTPTFAAEETTVTLPEGVTVPTVDSKKQEELERLKDEIGQMSSQLEQTQQLLGRLNNQKISVETVISKIDETMTDISARLDEVSSQIENTEKEIADSELELEEAEASAYDQHEMMKIRIQYIYEQGESDYLDLLFNSGSITEMLSRAEYISKISEYDRNMLQAYQETVDKIAAVKVKLEEERAQLAQLKLEKEDQLAAQQVLMEAKQTELSFVSNQISTKQEEAGQVVEAIEENEQLADNLEIQLKEEAEHAKQVAANLAAQMAEELKKQMEELQKQQESIAESIRESSIQASIAESIAQSTKPTQTDPGNSGENTTAAETKPTVPPTTAPTTAPETPSTGLSSLNLTWPVPGNTRITSHFGPRPQQPVPGTNLFHYGTDVAVPVGTSVLAAASGIVAYVGNGEDIGNSGCGNQVWILHEGGKYMTMYNHCSVLKVTKGQVVTEGQVIALSGNTGLSTGPHLDFRVYISAAYATYDKVAGDYVDPMTGEYINPNDSSGTRRPCISITYKY